jgi:alpha-galactosidase
VSGQLLNVPGASNAGGVQLIQWPDDNGANSQWRVNTGYTITARSDGLSVATSGATVVQSSTAGQWTLVPEPDPNTPYKLVNGNSGGRMDVSGDSTADSAGVLQWQDNGRTDQRWYVRAAGNGFDTITNVNSGKLLNIPGPTTTNGTQLIQYHDDGGTNSRWQVVDAGPNQVRFVSEYDGQVADDFNNSLSNGAAIIEWPSDSGTNQDWSLVPLS